MGYYTYYLLTVDNVKDEAEFNYFVERMKAFELDDIFDEGEFYHYEDGNMATFSCYESDKWYDHDDDMINLSLEFPNMVFELQGEGEEKEDLWRTYYHNGLMEECAGRIVYDKPRTIIWNGYRPS